MLGIKGILGQQASEADTGIATLRDITVISSKGKKDVLVEHYRKLGTPTANETFDAEFEKETNAWAEANVGESKRENRGLGGLQREYKRRSTEVCG